jgi:hypothetical protein
MWRRWTMGMRVRIAVRVGGDERWDTPALGRALASKDADAVESVLRHSSVLARGPRRHAHPHARANAASRGRATHVSQGTHVGQKSGAMATWSRRSGRPRDRPRSTSSRLVYLIAGLQRSYPATAALLLSGLRIPGSLARIFCSTRPRTDSSPHGAQDALIRGREHSSERSRGLESSRERGR